MIAGPTVNAARRTDRCMGVLLERCKRRTQWRSERCWRTIWINVASFAGRFSFAPFCATILWDWLIDNNSSSNFSDHFGSCRVLFIGTFTWNHTWTRDSLRCSFRASSSRANTSGYGARSNARSSSSNWNAVNVVLDDGKKGIYGQFLDSRRRAHCEIIFFLSDTKFVLWQNYCPGWPCKKICGIRHRKKVVTLELMRRKPIKTFFLLWLFRIESK